MRFLLLLALLPLACGGKARSPYVRVVDPGGRAYYTHTSNALYSEAAGFVTFRDLVTREDVRLANGRYSAEPVARAEVSRAQDAYLADPTKAPEGTYVPGQGADGSLWR